MKYADFLKVLLYYKKYSENISELHDIGIDFYEGKYKLSSIVETIVDTTFASHYTKEGIDWINWFIYEADWGTKDFSTQPCVGLDENGNVTIIEPAGEVRWGAHDENGKPICHSYESLWEYIEQFKIKSNN